MQLNVRPQNAMQHLLCKNLQEIDASKSTHIFDLLNKFMVFEALI